MPEDEVVINTSGGKDLKDDAQIWHEKTQERLSLKIAENEWISTSVWILLLSLFSNYITDNKTNGCLSHKKKKSCPFFLKWFYTD